MICKSKNHESLVTINCSKLALKLTISDENKWSKEFLSMSTFLLPATTSLSVN